LIEGFTGEVEIFVRCQDYFGNFNLNEYEVNFCINSGPDSTPVSHSLTVTSPNNNAILSYETFEKNLTMWINEPAECKYDLIQGKAYNEMENSFNCKTSLTEREIFGWRCSTTLTNLGSENNFYIKCNDQPWFKDNQSERNVNIEDFEYNLFVSESELEIDSISVLYSGAKTELSQETFTEIKGGGSSFSVEIGIKTSAGKENGISECSYRWNNDLIPFLNTNSNTHKQKLTLVNGNYNIPLTCEDDAGNKVSKNAKFSLIIDNSAPRVVRTYHQSGRLNIITNEQAKCYFSFDEVKQCNFNINDAEDMETGFSLNHKAKWINGEKYYIKCKDVWENQNPRCAVEVITN